MLAIESLAQLLPLAVALVPVAAPLAGWLGIDMAPLVALALTKKLPEACAAGMVLVDGGYCPGLRYECQSDLGTDESTRCGEYARKGGCPVLLEPRRFCVDRYEWPNLVGENPRVYVSWYQAKELCWTVGKRLCRRSEWMLACEGPKRLPYPYGYVRQPSPCNIDRGSIAFDVGAILNPDTREEELSRLWQADPIGSHPACVSSFGAYDMSGNVDEWTDNQGDDPTTREVSTLNGGYWGPVRDTCRLTTRAHGPTFRFYQVGFRCCSDANDGIETPPIVMHRTESP
ncbi:MAG TPA: SUMF1/EgtB/PvdO family nonheme iron enzyme [Polyangiaceae bacterium]|nr:SUMF1/EgtB/PvdO family nonheme iron enzyme [Polyangiaceae bacterium]